MRVDHVVYAAEEDGLIATAKRVGAQLGVEPADGGIHPRFGTRNLILPLLDHRFVEVVEPLDHPVTDKVPFGQAVRARCDAGGGWLGWVVEVEDMRVAENLVGRNAVPGLRHRDDGTEVTWRQLGINGLISDPQVPYFIEWDQSVVHPSQIGESDAALSALHIAGSPERVREWLGLTGEPGVDRDEWEPDIAFDFNAHKGNPGLVQVTFLTSEGMVSI